MTAPSTRSREETTSWIGVVIALGSSALLFGALLFAYGVLRVRATEWPVVPRGLAGISTALVALSSLALWRGRVAAAAVLGGAFLAAQVLLWTRTWPAAPVFWALAIVHAAHAVAGVAALGVAALRRRPAGLWAPYWHFVGVVWLLIFVIVVLP